MSTSPRIHLPTDVHVDVALALRDHATGAIETLRSSGRLPKCQNDVAEAVLLGALITGAATLHAAYLQVRSQQTNPSKAMTHQTYAEALAAPIEVANRILQVAAPALEAEAARLGGILHELDMPGAEGLTHMAFKWPGGLSITGPASESANGLKAAADYWLQHVDDVVFLRVRLDLSSEETTYRDSLGEARMGGGPAVATFDSDGRVIVRDEVSGKVLSCSLPGQPYRLKPHRA